MSKASKVRLTTAQKTVKRLMKDFGDWYSLLSTMDKQNFITLINLPTALDVLAKMPEGKYREMALFAVAMIKSDAGICAMVKDG